MQGQRELIEMLIIDTDIIIDVLRGHPPAIAWFESLDDAEIYLPGFVVMELIQGCRNKKEQRYLLEKITYYKILWPEPGDCEKALSIFANIYLSSSTGIIDVLVAQIAISKGHPLFTFNQNHYKAIPELNTIQPYVRQVNG